MIRLYVSSLCPFAQRARAVVRRLGIPVEQIEVDLDRRDPGFLALTPTGRVPLLLDGDLKLYESLVVCEYLADMSGWNDAFPAEPGLRARHRLAMHRWDDAVIGAWFRALKDPASFDADAAAALGRELDELEATLARTPGPADGLLAYHVAPFWARMRWLEDHVPATAALAARPRLCAWLDEAAALPAVQATLPERESTVRRYLERFRDAAPAS